MTYVGNREFVFLIGYARDYTRSYFTGIFNLTSARPGSVTKTVYADKGRASNRLTKFQSDRRSLEGEREKRRIAGQDLRAAPRGTLDRQPLFPGVVQ